MNIQEVRSRFPEQERKLWEIDRILIETPREDGEEARFAIDLRADYSDANIRMGAGSPTLGRRVAVVDALIAMDEYLDGVEIEHLDVWGAGLNNANLEALLATRWFSGLRSLNLGSNRISKKGLDALGKHAVAAQLDELRLSYNKIGNALAKASFPALVQLDLVYAGVNDKALQKLGDAKLPKLQTLTLDGAALHSTTEKLVNAGRMGDPLPEPEYSDEALEVFAKSPIARQLETLGLGTLTLNESQAAIIGDHFDALKTLDLTDARMSAASVSALASGRGLRSLEKLVLARTFAPNYSGGGEKQAPSKATADAMRAIGQSGFAGSLRHLVLNQIVLGPMGVKALLEAPLPKLDRLDLDNCQLGDEGLAAIAAKDTTITKLIAGSNGISAAGLQPLLDSPLAGQITSLSLQYNDLGDDGACRLATNGRLGALTALSLTGTGLTDIGAKALAEGLAGQIEVLILLDNRVSDDGANAWTTTPTPKLTRLHLGKNCLTEEGIAACRARFGGIALYLEEQDPSKLPPRFVGNDVMRFVEVKDVNKPERPAFPPAVRETYPYPAWVQCDDEDPNWVYAMPKHDDGYEVNVVNTTTGKTIAAEPPIRNPLPAVSISRDQRWMAVKAFEDGAYVVSLEDGAATRLGDVLTHQDGGSCFCDGRIVVLDCDTDGDWEGRLDVYTEHDGGWRREHSIGGFFGVRDGLVPLANQRLFAVTGRGGFFLCAIRGSQLRLLGCLPVDRYDVFGVGDRVFVRILYRYTYELVNLDEVLDAAFASGESPTSLGIDRNAWAL